LLGGAHARADEPWTVKTIKKGLGDQNERNGGVAGWDATGTKFGICEDVCPDRDTGWRRTCFALTPTTGTDARGTFEELKLEEWEARGFLKSPATKVSRKVDAGQGMTVTASGVVSNAEMNECKWSLKVAQGKLGGKVTGGGSECYEVPEHSLYLSPDGKRVAVVVFYLGDHGCGDADGAIVELPRGLAAGFLNGGLSKHKKDPASALLHYDAALALDPEHAKARFNRACARALQGDAAGAAADVKVLVAADKAKWTQAIAKDSDFDRVRTAPEFVEALK
jgi:hypothetical protein